MFVSLLYLIVHVPTFTVRMARAGHNGPLFFSARSQRAGELRPRGIAIGIDRGGGLFERELEVQQFVLQPGDAVVLYTDGITEAKDPDGAEYSLDRLRELVLGGAGRGAQEIVDAVLADLEEHRREAERSDDSTLIVVRRRPPR
jgi:sigma-B regulation protein RsbU (phosphoserine phosphatase)